MIDPLHAVCDSVGIAIGCMGLMTSCGLQGRHFTLVLAGAAGFVIGFIGASLG